MTFTANIPSRNAPLKVALCTPCMLRLEHLQQTLPQNVETFKDDPNVEFCIIAYGDRETAEWVERWAQETHPDIVAAGRIRLGYTEAEYYHTAKAKNLSALLASDDAQIVVNMDADNFASKAYIQKVREVFQREGNIYLQKAHTFRPPELAGKNMANEGEERSGHMGRFAMRMKDFRRFGYDERVEGWGGEDGLLALHLGKQGFRQVPLDGNLIGETLRHKDNSRTENMSPEAKRLSEERLAGRNFPTLQEFPTANPNGFGFAEVDVMLSHNSGRQQFGVSREQQRTDRSI